MIALVLLMVVILLVAGGVVLYVSFPHRGEEVPGAPWLGDAMKRSVDTVGNLTLPSTDTHDDRSSHSAGREHSHR